MTLVDPATYVATIDAEAASVAEVARTGPMDARVPHMRRWRLQDVIAHLGGVHRWAAESALAVTTPFPADVVRAFVAGPVTP